MPFPILSALRIRCGALAAASCLLATSALAGSPRASHIYPGGAQRGGEMEVTCTGTNLEDARTLLFDEPGSFESQVLTADKGKFTAKIKVAPDARLGEHTLRIITASGIADVRTFYVTPFPMVAEADSKVRPKPVQHIELNTTVYGHTPDDAVAKYDVDLKKGQRLSVEVIGLRLHTQTPYDPFLAITKADGTPVIAVDDTGFSRQDPVASILAPEDGKYIISVRDTTNAGPGVCAYLMNIGTFARPLAVYPAGGPAGETVKVKLIGDASGPIEQSVKLPEKADDSFDLYTVNQDQPTPQPNEMRVSYFPNVLETEPNNDIAHATVVAQEFPVALNGIIDEKDDVDYFKFKVKKDQQFDFTVFARRLGSPLDSVIDIYNEKGGKIGTNDDAGGPDSYLRWKAPADGEYCVAVHDQLYRGGPNYVYRLEVTAVEPKLTAWLPEMTINQNQDRRAITVPKGNRYASLVRIKRADVAGDVQLEPVALPPGITASVPTVDKSVDTVPVVFEAAPDAAIAAKDFDMVARLVEPPKDVKVISQVDHLVDVMEYNNQRPFYVIHQHLLPAAVTEEIPVKISLVQPKVPLLQTGSMNLKVVAERKNDFKGPITIGLLYSPTGIGTAGLQQIKEGENEGTVAVSANGNAPLQKWKVCIVGSADFGKGPVWFSTQLVDLEVAAPLVGGKLVRTYVDQGDTTTMTVKLDQKIPFEGKAKLSLLGLPPNTTADEQEITKDDTEVKFNIKAEKTTPAGQHKQLFCQFTLQKDGEQLTSTFAQGGILRVDKATVAKNDAAPVAPAETAKK
ncbi:MAG: PPC domain-containing protein [Chthoniobacter sp.]|uniref:PPC domain-containing protein n=1 Tax=Chthoniobacter sp. TaxID=2510640 RepID=UPI0032A1BFDC